MFSLSIQNPIILSLSLIFSAISFLAEASVPPSETFQYINEGEFGEYIVEYDANYRALDPFAQPFQLCFYNTTPNEYTLALRMGTVRSESLMRWVWEANRNKPVRENASLTFSTDGNLVLADSDGAIAWQTNTADKGVIGFKLLSNGNMVLYGSNGEFIWQSFDSPTDTLLVGQSLKIGGVTTLISRVSRVENVNGPYSLVMEEKTLSLYYKSPNSPNRLIYFSFSDLISVSEGLKYVTLGPDLTLEYESGSVTLRRAKYNTTLTYLRLEIDGNVRLHTYEDNADWGAWEVTYALFDRNSWESECQLPQKCGDFGVCDDNQCVACPSPKGLMGWSENCEAEKVSSCGVNEFRYYKVQGVDHFSVKYSNGDGPMKMEVCRNKCSEDCKCLGYFYHTKSFRCWVVYDLGTSTKVENSTHLGYIKAPTKKVMLSDI
ncbi:epidermis-specific secreted glycoprotein EP1-like [Euphorbia lathyris]|uniref:epidermis-specific secreted glycoprotein EP1-like n=1 Tax=Euphorbia lathyris TaxID=212925 RepID=UPI0033140DEA